MNLQLQCAFCRKSFSDFKPLGGHVQSDHPEIGRLLRRLKISAAGQEGVSPTPSNSTEERLSGRVDNLDVIEERASKLVLKIVYSIRQEIDDMASKLKLPPPESGGGEGDYNPWLTPEALGKSGKGTLKLLGNVRESSSQFGAGIVIDVKVGNSSYSWTVKFSSGNYTRLHKRFGQNPDSWKGSVNVETKEYMGKEYVAVV